MKLKKIASLMLAGIMAVSMLAGCKSGDNGNSGEESPIVDPVASGVADGANSVRTKYTIETLGLSFEEDKALLDALTAASGDYKSADIEAIAKNGLEVPAADSKSLVSKIYKSLGGTETAYGSYTDFQTLSKGTKKFALVYTVGGNYSAEQAGALVISEINGSNSGEYINDTTFKTTAPGLKASYDADIAAVKVTSKEDTSKSIWVVAVLFTQTVVDATV